MGLKIYKEAFTSKWHNYSSKSLAVILFPHSYKYIQIHLFLCGYKNNYLKEKLSIVNSEVIINAFINEIQKINVK